ncbi:MAG: hypothetical protein V1779_04615 [bacterium]
MNRNEIEEKSCLNNYELTITNYETKTTLRLGFPGELSVKIKKMKNLTAK